LLRADTSGLAVLVVWEHVTPSDHGLQFPGTRVLARVSDARAVQFWDDDRLLSKAMARDLPADTLTSVADTSAATPVAWDCVSLYRPGVAWTGRFPVPDWAGRPVVDVIDRLRRQLDAIEAAPIPSPVR